MKGGWLGPLDFPRIQGADVAGVVVGSERDGGFAEYVVVPAPCANRVDDSPLSDLELAALPIA